MRRVPPVAWAAGLAGLVILVLLATSAPPAVTLRAGLRPVTAEPVANGQNCSDALVVPGETDALRVRPVPGTPLPTSATLASGDGYRVASVGPARRDGQDIVFRLAHPVDRDHPAGEACYDGPKGAQLWGDYGQAWVTLLGAHRGSWLSAIPELSRRAGVGRGTVLGAAALPLGILLMLGSWVIAVRLGVGPMRRPEPVSRRTAALIGLVGAFGGFAYAMTTPPFQAPDEMVHLRYAELIVDRFALPHVTTIDPSRLSLQLQAALADTNTDLVAFSPDRRPPWSGVEDRALDAHLKRLPSGGSHDTFDNASAQPPAYYAIVAAGMKLAGGSILDRLLVARLLSALIFGLGVAGAVAFAREAVPRAGGLVVAAGLALACMPIVGFIGGSVNPDALLMTVSAWSLALTARILRRGLTSRRAIGLGLLVGLGIITKLTFVGLLPTFVVLGLVVLVRGRRARTLGRTSLQLAGAVAATFVALPYVLWALLGGRGLTFGPAGDAPVAALHLREIVTYAIELFFGQFGPLKDRIPGSGPLDIWGAGLVGKLGWQDYGFPRDVVLAAVAFWVVCLVVALLGVARSARARRSVPVDGVVYLVAVLGTCYAIARAGLAARLTGAIGFEQARYLIPVAAIGVGGYALALRTLPGERIRGWAAALLVAAALVHMTSGYLITIGRYFA